MVDTVVDRTGSRLRLYAGSSFRDKIEFLDEVIDTLEALVVDHGSDLWSLPDDVGDRDHPLHAFFRVSSVESLVRLVSQGNDQIDRVFLDDLRSVLRCYDDITEPVARLIRACEEAQDRVLIAGREEPEGVALGTAQGPMAVVRTLPASCEEPWRWTRLARTLGVGRSTVFKWLDQARDLVERTKRGHYRRSIKGDQFVKTAEHR